MDGRSSGSVVTNGCETDVGEGGVEVEGWHGDCGRDGGGVRDGFGDGAIGSGVGATDKIELQLGGAEYIELSITVLLLFASPLVPSEG